MVGAAQIGQAGPNMEAMAKSKGAAYSVYLIMNRVSKNFHFQKWQSFLSLFKAKAHHMDFFLQAFFIVKYTFFNRYIYQDHVLSFLCYWIVINRHLIIFCRNLTLIHFLMKDRSQKECLEI